MGLGPTTILSGGFVRCAPDWSRTEFMHESYAKFYFVIAGSASYENEHGVEPLRAGYGYFFPPHQGSRHTCAVSMDVYWMHLSIDSPVLDLRLTRLRTIRSWPLGAWPQWQGVYQQLPELVAHHGLALELRTQAMIMDTSAMLLAGEPEVTDDALEGLRSRLQPALEILDGRYREPPPLALIAQACGLSVPHFHRGFSAAYRTTPYRYMLRRRMDLSHQLLCNTVMPIGEVAAAAGYDDQFYFSRVFKRYFHLSPERFRAERRAAP